jgi:phosphate transport system substrate-binding protein
VTVGPVLRGRLVPRALLLTALLVVADTRSVRGQTADTAVTLDGATAYEVTRELNPYAPLPTLGGQLRSVGTGNGTTLVNAWVNEFATFYPAVVFDIHGGGAVGGLAALEKGQTDLVPIDRPLSPAESDSLRAALGHPPTVVQVAQDALAVYVNLHNPVEQLTLTQLDAIFSRAPRRGGRPIETWGELGVSGPLAHQLVSRYSRVHNSSSFVYFQDSVLLGADYRLETRFEPAPHATAQSVGADDAGIGSASVMYVTRRVGGDPLVGADGVAYLPTRDNVLSGKYPLARPMYLVINRAPGRPIKPVVLEFLRFATSRRGQRIVATEGAYPLTPAMERSARAAFQ